VLPLRVLPNLLAALLADSAARLCMHSDAARLNLGTSCMCVSALLSSAFPEAEHGLPERVRRAAGAATLRPAVVHSWLTRALEQASGVAEAFGEWWRLCAGRVEAVC